MSSFSGSQSDIDVALYQNAGRSLLIPAGDHRVWFPLGAATPYGTPYDITSGGTGGQHLIGVSWNGFQDMVSLYTPGASSSTTDPMITCLAGSHACNVGRGNANALATWFVYDADNLTGTQLRVRLASGTHGGIPPVLIESNSGAALFQVTPSGGIGTLSGLSTTIDGITGSPVSVLSRCGGSLALNISGGSSTSLYVHTGSGCDSTNWTAFGAAGITQLTGGVSATGPGSVPATLNLSAGNAGIGITGTYNQTISNLGVLSVNGVTGAIIGIGHSGVATGSGADTITTTTTCTSSAVPSGGGTPTITCTSTSYASGHTHTQN